MAKRCLNSRRKGARGETEFCQAWEKVTGIPLKRNWTQCFSGGGKSNPDVKGWDVAHIEVKRTESVHFFKWVGQVLTDCAHRIPMISHKRNHGDWWVFLRLEDLPMLAYELTQEMERRGRI